MRPPDLDAGGHWPPWDGPTHEATNVLSDDVVEYFKGVAAEARVPYQSLINRYLRDCLTQNGKVKIHWPSAA